MGSGRDEEGRSADSAEPLDTQGLAARTRAGDFGRFRELYERVAPSLYAWTRVRTRPAPGTGLDPDDVLQEVWLRAFERLPEFDEKRGSFRAWIFGIAKIVAFEARRMRGPRVVSRETSARSSTALESWPAVATSVRTRMSRDESVAKLLEEIGSLDPVDRGLVVHLGMEDLPSAVVATRLGMEKGAVVKRWQRLRERLRGSAFVELLEL